MLLLLVGIILAQIPERRACPDRAEADVNKHVEDFSEQVLNVSGRLFRLLCPKAFIVRYTSTARYVMNTHACG